MLVIVPGQAVAWDVITQADNFSLWTQVSCCLQRDVLVYLYLSYWMNLFSFPWFSSRDLFLSLLREWRMGRMHSKLAVVLPLKLRAEVFVCLFLCAWSCCCWSHSHLQPEQCHQGTGDAPQQHLCVHQGKNYFSSVRLEECCPQAGPALAETHSSSSLGWL